MESHPQKNVILKLIVRIGNVWTEQDNEWSIIFIIKYLKSDYIINNDINNIIYPLFFIFKYSYYILYIEHFRKEHNYRDLKMQFPDSINIFYNYTQSISRNVCTQ